MQVPEASEELLSSQDKQIVYYIVHIDLIHWHMDCIYSGKEFRKSGCEPAVQLWKDQNRYARNIEGTLTYVLLATHYDACM